VLKVIRERQPAADVIMLTGHGTIGTAIEATRLGAFDYLSKPCPLDESEVCIQRAQVLHEMATGRQAFQGQTTLTVLDAPPPGHFYLPVVPLTDARSCSMSAISCGRPVCFDRMRSSRFK